MKSTLKSLIEYPLTRGMNPDDPKTTLLRRQVIQEKPFLRRIYCEWYEFITRSLPSANKPVLEIGSGAGFLKEYIPELITSEIFHCNGVNSVVDATDLPFGDGSLSAIVMTDVLHHIPDSRQFFSEAIRCLDEGGAIIMIEPWVTSWSRFVYGNLHHEPFIPDAAKWEFPSSGPLSGANGALPWILFERDKTLFEAEFPQLQIQSIKLTMPFRYLLSGGVSLRSLAPPSAFNFLQNIENSLFSMKRWAMFAEIVLRKNKFSFSQKQ